MCVDPGDNSTAYRRITFERVSSMSRERSCEGYGGRVFGTPQGVSTKPGQFLLTQVGQHPGQQEPGAATG